MKFISSGSEIYSFISVSCDDFQGSDDSVQENAFDDIKNLTRVSWFIIQINLISEVLGCIAVPLGIAEQNLRPCDFKCLLVWQKDYEVRAKDVLALANL